MTPTRRRNAAHLATINDPLHLLGRDRGTGGRQGDEVALTRGGAGVHPVRRVADVQVHRGGHRADRTLHEPHRGEPHPTREVVVQRISAHSHHKHLTTRHTRAFAQVTVVELRGLEPLTL